MTRNETLALTAQILRNDFATEDEIDGALAMIATHEFTADELTAAISELDYLTR